MTKNVLIIILFIFVANKPSGTGSECTHPATQALGGRWAGPPTQKAAFWVGGGPNHPHNSPLNHLQQGMRTTRAVAFQSFFMAQIQDSSSGYSCQSLSTMNSKKWRHKPCCVSEQKSGRFAVRDFRACGLSEQNSFFVTRNFSSCGHASFVNL